MQIKDKIKKKNILTNVIMDAKTAHNHGNSLACIAVSMGQPIPSKEADLVPM